MSITVKQIRNLVNSNAFKLLKPDDVLRINIEEQGSSNMDVILDSLTIEHHTDQAPDDMALTLTVQLLDLGDDSDLEDEEEDDLEDNEEEFDDEDEEDDWDDEEDDIDLDDDDDLGEDEDEDIEEFEELDDEDEDDPDLDADNDNESALDDSHVHGEAPIN